MFVLKRLRKSCVLLVCLGLIAASLGCDDASGPDGLPDVSGDWVGQYSVTACSLDGARDPFLCDEIFFVGASLILDLSLDQSGAELTGLIAQGQLLGNVEGTVDEDGIVGLAGVIGPGDTVATTFILGWQTGLVGDSLVGSWRFRTEDNSASGFGAATVDAALTLLGPSVTGIFGCAVEGDVALDGQVEGSLERGDCMLPDNSFFDVYTFTGSTGDSVEVNLRSLSLDSYLLVAIDSDQVLEDDDSGGGATGLDAQIVLVFESAARVLLLANSFLDREVGTYTLSVVDLGPSGIAADGIAPRSPSAAPVRAVRAAGSRKPFPPVRRSPLKSLLRGSERLTGDLRKLP